MSYAKLVATESMQTIIDSYLTEEAFATASASYGTSTEKFLVPTKAGVVVTGGASGGNSGGSSSGGSSDSGSDSGGGGSVNPGTGDMEP